MGVRPRHSAVSQARLMLLPSQGSRRGGGAVYASDFAVLEVSNSVMSNNIAVREGGAVRLLVNSTALLDHDLFEENTAEVRPSFLLLLTVLTDLPPLVWRSALRLRRSQGCDHRLCPGQQLCLCVSSVAPFTLCVR